MFAILEAQPAGSYVHTINYGNEIYALYAPDLILWNGNTDYTPAGYGFQWVDGMTNMISRIKATGRTGTTVLPNAYGVPEGGTPFNYIKFGSAYPSSDSAPAAAVARATPDGTKYCFGVNAAGATSGMLGWLVFLETDAVQYPDPSATYPAGGNVRYGGANDVPSGHSYGEILPNDFKIGLVYCKAYEGDVPKFVWVIYCESWNFCRTYTIQYHWQDIVFTLSEDGDPEGDEPDMPIPIPDLPALDISSAGVRLFRAGNFNALINYMWGSDTLLNAIYKLIGDQTPYECIVAFNLFPYGEALSSGTSTEIRIGNVGTGVSAPTTGQFCSIDFGTYTISRRFNNALDYAPYTTIELFLPFIGKIKLPTDFVMGKTIGVTYHMDCLTGGCFAFITTNTDGVIQCEGGSCLIQLPITAQTANGARQAISSAFGAGVTVATGGAGAKIGGVGNAIDAALTARDSYTTFGGMSLANGYLGLSNPIVYIHRPIDKTPSGYNDIVGYAASVKRSLTGLSGFTQVKDINLGIAGASREDLEEIEALLKEGVYL